ncbi:PREDICTED: odorant receptor 9a-like [Eufriesea mexicana]|uniref:odorant receptor 9a-like n=1 Tax=Eufriesea mexicana TaxID=516756 RepID=UPI00083BD1AA|nr:PREDICTED: odorant receptor 9a-like [Eufriesea mexicana]
MNRLSVFQKQRTHDRDIFDILYYKMAKKYLQLLGQDPQQTNEFRHIIVIIVVISITGNMVPTSIELYTSLCNNDMDGFIECLPHFIAATISVVKIINIHYNRENFSKLFVFVTKEWEQLKSSNELHILEEIITQGSKMAQLYRSKLSYFNLIRLLLYSLLTALVLFLFVPLFSPILDIIHPLNQTRPRQQLLKVNYLFFNDEDYFFYVYFQLAWGSIIVVNTIIAADWLFILIIHHSSGLFAVCGQQVQKAAKSSNEAISLRYTYEQFKNCVMMHDEAIQFYNILNQSSRYSYLAQVGLNMLAISATAVQAVVNLNRPDEAFRSAVFCGANQFHLFVLSLPGQVLLDHCIQLANNLYFSTWYKTPVKIQKMIFLMQIRSKRPCTLTAGGLYEMNMENFGVTFKTCMSYFTVIMSLK